MIIHFHGTSQQGKGEFVPDPGPDVYVLSISPTEHHFPPSGDISESTIVTQVTCTLNGVPTSFSAAITYNPDSILNSLDTTSGVSGEDIFAKANIWQGTACKGHDEITVTCGDQTAILTIWHDGTVTTCTGN